MAMAADLGHSLMEEVEVEEEEVGQSEPSDLETSDYASYFAALVEAEVAVDCWVGPKVTYDDQFGTD